MSKDRSELRRKNKCTCKHTIRIAYRSFKVVRWQNGKCKGVGTKTLPDVLIMYLIHHTGSIPVLTTINLPFRLMAGQLVLVQLIEVRVLEG
jgi:hypothetical protein